jgi:hypothetical protein
MPQWVERETLERSLIDLEATREWLTQSSRSGEKRPTKGA